MLIGGKLVGHVDVCFDIDGRKLGFLLGSGLMEGKSVGFKEGTFEIDGVLVENSDGWLETDGGMLWPKRDIDVG